MQAAVDRTLILLLCAKGRGRTESRADAADRRAGLGDPILRLPADDPAPAQRRPPGEREAHPATNAADGLEANLPEAQHEQAGERAQDLSLSPQRSAGRTPKPSLVFRHHLSAHAAHSPSGSNRWRLDGSFLYLVAIMDWHTRKVLSWRISNTLEADFCVDALNEAIHKFGPPEIMNTDQGSQFTSFAWTDMLRRSGVRISMDGKGRFLDNIFIERLWRTLKYECVYLHAWETGSETKAAIRKWMTFYNHQRPHSALGGRSPALVYWQRNDINQPDQQVQRVA